MMTSAEIVEVPEAGKFRMYFPQVNFSIFLLHYLNLQKRFVTKTNGILCLIQILASTVKNLLLLCTGLSVAFPTIVIPALKGLNVENNPNEVLTLTAIQSSWLGTLTFSNRN